MLCPEDQLTKYILMGIAESASAPNDPGECRDVMVIVCDIECRMKFGSRRACPGSQRPSLFCTLQHQSPLRLHHCTSHLITQIVIDIANNYLQPFNSSPDPHSIANIVHAKFTQVFSEVPSRRQASAMT
jgi:hypothetical protein